MATAPFAALEVRANASVMARLSNAVASYTPGAGVARDVLVIFDAQYQEVIDGLVASSGPAAICSMLDAPSAARGDLLTIRGVDYQVVKPMPDGAGLVVLQLRLQE